jgi:hypothetical protein
MLLVLFYAASAFGTLTIAHRLGAPLPTIVEPYAGMLVVDGGERTDPLSIGSRIEGPGASDLMGARALWPIGETWTVGIEYGYARFDMREFSTGCEEGVQAQCSLGITATDMHGVLAQVRRTWPTRIVDLHVTGGTGILLLKADEADSQTLFSGSRHPSLSDIAPPDFEVEREAAFLLGAGVSRPLHSRVAITAEARDLIHPCRNDPDEYKERSSWFLCERPTTLHHWQLTTGLRIRF